ncbi:hypothetical protein ABEB36_011738 [Hypothenemus hampei]|uniref:AAA+ ATPase domain-containing protein n=1 Tax=Hypothenemus hampei TaxID=57062 RepID=A0ABD1E8V4_HYPHA
MDDNFQLTNQEQVACPICNRQYLQAEIDGHVNRCIFLNSAPDGKLPRKRTSSTPLNETRASRPKLVSSPQKTPASHTTHVPLAVRARPKILEDFHGQSKVLGKGSVLRTLLESGEICNLILWGPPGCGKTSLSQVIQEICNRNPFRWKFSSLCAATAGVKEVQSIMALAKNDLKFNKKTVLFMDEIHRFNKKQQDVFLMSVEKGEIILIGATTENPSFVINNALLSRCKVVVFEKLSSEDLKKIITKALGGQIEISGEALKFIADVSDGDARIALNNLELVLQYYERNPQSSAISLKDVEDKLKKSSLLYDKTGEEHYNIISAVHKSIRGSDDNAALYWTTRMILSGEDPRFIARRLVRAASEDIGNADPNALPLAIATMQGCQLLGMPEADVLLAQCAIYLARAPKSREADSALAKAKSLIKEHKGPQPSVPMHIRNAPTKLMKELGYGRLEEGQTAGFMPPQYKDVNFFR